MVLITQTLGTALKGTSRKGAEDLMGARRAKSAGAAVERQPQTRKESKTSNDNKNIF